MFRVLSIFIEFVESRCGDCPQVWLSPSFVYLNLVSARPGSLGRYCDRFAPSGKKRTSCGEDIALLRRLEIAFEGSEGLDWFIMYQMAYDSGVSPVREL